MIIGVPKEIKDNETRVGLVPSGVTALREAGHEVLVEVHAGEGSSLTDQEYEEAGASILGSAAEVWQRADLIVKVKEPQKAEYDFFRPGLILFTYLHLAPLPELTDKLVAAKVNGVAYETIRERDGSLPLLTPMSEVAGRMSVQVGAQYLERPSGGRGILLGGVPGVAPGNVVILGGGIVGINAARIACGLGARVYLLDTNLDRLRYLSEVMPGNCFTVMGNLPNLRALLKEADLVIGAVLIPGAKAPKLITREMLKGMKPGAVLVDVAIDQGGCFETSKPTTHTDPTFVVDGIIHYCVANMPGAVARTSTMALTNATLPYALEIAEKGWLAACRENTEIRLGVNVARGKVTFKGVADAFGMKYTPIDSLLG